MQLVGRTTCLYCAQEGVTTELIQTPRGGFCPTHGDRTLLAAMQQLERAEAFLSLPKPDPTRGLSAARKAA